MLVDKLRLDFIGGRGGDGGVSFAKYGRSLGKNGNLYYPQKGKPDGGNGGKGGDIYLEGSNNIYDLTDFTSQQSYKADDGSIGQPLARQGKSGNDVIIKVPVITVVTDIKGNPILTIRKDKERKLLARGGAGGIGNYEFRAGQERTLFKHTQGEAGQKVMAFMELRLFADIVFIGFPNAGKSSMLNALTNANVKVASYPFTTIQPQLGVMKENIKLMDLPGLIEGVSEGKGLGKSFSKHAVGAKVIAHFVSLESDDLEETYLAIRKELEAFSEKLLEKPEIILATKADLFTEKEIQEKIKPLKKYAKQVIPVSSYDMDTIKVIENIFLQSINS